MPSDGSADPVFLDRLLQAWGLLGLVCAGIVLVLLFSGNASPWCILAGFLAVTGGPAGFAYLRRRRAGGWVSVLVPLFAMLVGAYGMMAASWLLFLAHRH